MSTAKTRRDTAALIRRLLDYPGLEADGPRARDVVAYLQGAAQALAISARPDSESTTT